MILAVMALQILTGAGLGHAPGEIPAWAHPDAPGVQVAWVGAQAGEGGGNPACRAEFCQPRVAIPGRDPSFDTRGKRTELALAAIDHLQIGVVSSVARAIKTSGLQVDIRPSQLETGSVNRGGFGSVNVGVRWRLDAWHTPTWIGSGR